MVITPRESNIMASAEAGSESRVQNVNISRKNNQKSFWNRSLVQTTTHEQYNVASKSFQELFLDYKVLCDLLVFDACLWLMNMANTLLRLCTLHTFK